MEKNKQSNSKTSIKLTDATVTYFTETLLAGTNTPGTSTVPDYYLIYDISSLVATPYHVFILTDTIVKYINLTLLIHPHCTIYTRTKLLKYRYRYQYLTWTL